MNVALRDALESLTHKLERLVEGLWTAHGRSLGTYAGIAFSTDIGVVQNYHDRLVRALAVQSHEDLLKSVNACAGINKGLGDNGMFEGNEMLGDLSMDILRTSLSIAEELRRHLGMPF